MKIILKNSTTKKLSIYQPREPNNIRYGDIITFVREVQGDFNFLLSYYLPYDQTPYEISNQQDLNKLIDIQKQSKYIQISIKSLKTPTDKSFEQYFGSHQNHCLSKSNSNNLIESSNQMKSEKSQIGKFRKTRNLNQQQSDVSQLKQSQFIKSQVTQVVQKEMPTIVSLITNQLSKKKLSTTELIQPSHKYTFKPQSKKQIYKNRRIYSHNQYNNLTKNDQIHEGTFKISEVNTQNSQVITNPQISQQIDPYAIFNHNKRRQIESAKYLRAPTFYENHYNQYPTSKQIYRNHKKTCQTPTPHVHQYNSYQNSGNILLQVVTPRKKSAHNKKKVFDCKNCQSRKQIRKLQKKTEEKKLKHRQQKGQKKTRPKKLKEKILDQKIAKVSKTLGRNKDSVIQWVQEYCYLQPIEIIQKIKQNQKKHKTVEQKSSQISKILKPQSHSSFVKSVASSKRIVTQATNMTKGQNLLHRIKRVKSKDFQNPRSQLQDSEESKKSRKLSVKSISIALPCKTMRQKGGILIKMKQMFGEKRKSQIFKFIELHEHLSQESIIKKWIKKHQFVP